MIVTPNETLATHTTLRVGGTARFFIECDSEEEIKTALAFARERSLPFYILGSGSNVLASDAGFEGVVISPRMNKISFEEKNDVVIVKAEAGVVWDDLVREVGSRGLWGIENLAGIPGTVGAAPVQNIGAYGAEVKDTIVSIAALNTETMSSCVLTKEECEFGYRDSLFKRTGDFIITEVTFALPINGEASVAYADLLREREAGKPFNTPLEMANVVRSVRARKFPDLTKEGTAGSFFKNPFITLDAYNTLKEKYSDMPGFETNGLVKIPLAWILDHVLSLRGYRKGPVRLFEQQPLVLVADANATSADVDALAEEVTKKVFDATKINIEREVRVM
jgi:UDP-N-acetylmuramate dehydrogenase